MPRTKLVPAMLMTLVLFAGLGARATVAESVTFEGSDHDRILNTRYAARGLTISTHTDRGGFDLSPLFDDDHNSTGHRSWSKGNSAPSALLSNMLIIAESSKGSSDGVVPDPDGDSPAGSAKSQFAATNMAFSSSGEGTGRKSRSGSGGGSNSSGSGFSLASLSFSHFKSSGKSYGGGRGSYGGEGSSSSSGDHHFGHWLNPIGVGSLKSAFALKLSLFHKFLDKLRRWRIFKDIDCYPTPPDCDPPPYCLTDCDPPTPTPAPAPEPTSLSLLAAGSALLLICRRGRRRLRR